MDKPSSQFNHSEKCAHAFNDVWFFFLHFFCLVTWYCLPYGSRNMSSYGSQYVVHRIRVTIRFTFLGHHTGTCMGYQSLFYWSTLGHRVCHSVVYDKGHHLCHYCVVIWVTSWYLKGHNTCCHTGHYMGHHKVVIKVTMWSSWRSPSYRQTGLHMCHHKGHHRLIIKVTIKSPYGSPIISLDKSRANLFSALAGNFRQQPQKE